MADRKLTFEEFRRLSSEEERCRRYPELSDHDKFLARCSQPSGVVSVLCNSCVHKIKGKFACQVFPEGIPGEHSDRVDDDPTIECAPGIHYKPKE